MPRSSAPTRSRGSADFNLRILAPLKWYFDDRAGGREAFAAMCDAAGLESADFDRKVAWVSWETFELLLRETRRIVGSDEELMRACSYKMTKSYGPLRYFFWATSPALIYRGAEAGNRFFSTVSKFEVLAAGRNHARLRYTSARPESRLMCLSRQAQSTRLPVEYGMPAAHCVETSCIAKGDDACVYDFHWFERPRWVWTALGATIGLGATGLAVRAGLGVAALSWPVLGAAIALLAEQTLRTRGNDRARDHMSQALREAVNDEASVRRELRALEERQSEWARLLEETTADRLAMVEDAAKHLAALTARENRLLEYSHDLRAPLSVIKLNIQGIGDDLPEEQQTLRDTLAEADRMTEMVEWLIKSVASTRGLVTLRPARIEIGPLVEVIRRRVQALVFARDIRVSVFSNREAPESVEVDRMLLDRILDNLTTNAAKHTESGSIVVELDGTPGFFVIKISDTGPGIPEDEIEGIFQRKPRATNQNVERTGTGGFGLGLPIVVELLAQIGGRIEVMSRVGQGTTFWLFLPVKPLDNVVPIRNEERESGKMLREVVRIRKPGG